MARKKVQKDDEVLKKTKRGRGKAAPKEEEEFEEVEFEDEEIEDEDFEDEEDEDEDEEEDEEETDEGLFSSSPEPLRKKPVRSEGYDLFADFTNRGNQGEVFYYSIHKNGSYIARKEHPFSMDLLKEEFGAGSYRVYAKDYASNEIRGSQTFSIAGAPAVAAANPQAGANPARDPMEMFAFMQQLTKDSREEAKLLASKDRDSMTQVMTMFVTMQQQASQSMQALIQQTQQQTAQMMQSQAEATRQMFAATQNQMKDLATLATKKEEFSPLMLMKLVNDAESRGRETTERMLTRIDEKAEKEAHRIAEMELAKEGKEPSGIDKLLNMLTPVIGQALELQAAGVQNRMMNPAPALEPPASQPLIAAPTLAPAPAQTPSVMPPQKRHVKETITMDAKTKIEGILLPYVGGKLTERKAPEPKEALRILHQAGVAKADVIKWVTEDQVLALAKQHGVPALANGILKKFAHGVQDILKEKPAPASNA